MGQFVKNNNELIIYGEITKDIQFYHEYKGQKFYQTYVKTIRISGYEDVLPLVLPERLLECPITMGAMVHIKGQIRTYNNEPDRVPHLFVYVYAKEIERIDAKCTWDFINENHVKLEGHVCTEPQYRRTPKGRKIADFMLSVDGNRTAYIPCILWGNDAKNHNIFRIGSLCVIDGRMQSREYNKKIDENHSETRVAYEVSVINIKKIREFRIE